MMHFEGKDMIGKIDNSRKVNKSIFHRYKKLSCETLKLPNLSGQSKWLSHDDDEVWITVLWAERRNKRSAWLILHRWWWSICVSLTEIIVIWSSLSLILHTSNEWTRNHFTLIFPHAKRCGEKKGRMRCSVKDDSWTNTTHRQDYWYLVSHRPRLNFPRPEMQDHLVRRMPDSVQTAQPLPHDQHGGHSQIYCFLSFPPAKKPQPIIRLPFGIKYFTLKEFAIDTHSPSPYRQSIQLWPAIIGFSVSIDILYANPIVPGIIQMYRAVQWWRQLKSTNIKLEDSVRWPRWHQNDAWLEWKSPKAGSGFFFFFFTTPPLSHLKVHKCNFLRCLLYMAHCW